MTEREREDLIVDVAKAIKVTRSMRQLLTTMLLVFGLGFSMLIPRVLVPSVSPNLLKVVWLVLSVGIVGWVYTRKYPSDKQDVATIAHAIRSEPSTITEVKQGMRSKFGARVYIKIGGKRFELQTNQPAHLIGRFERLRLLSA